MITYNLHDICFSIPGSFLCLRTAIDIERAAQGQAKDFQRWLDHMPAVPEQYRQAAEKALLLLWNCQVPAQNKLTRRTIFSSKASMNSIWTWDNCFHALAIAEVDPQLAWDQILLPFDYQTQDGALPDSISDDRVSFGYTKPPIYGWAIHKLIHMLGIQMCLPYLSQLYKPLCRLTEWWYRQRGGENGMCRYYDGNDSGWDNSTTFDSGSPVEGVDLAAYLVLQLETLGEMADLLGYTEEATTWRARAQQQLALLLSEGVHDTHFLARTADTQAYVSAHSLLNMMPLILGRRLPPALIATTVHMLQPDGPFLTAYGLASESVHSPDYTPDGYWRGPVWAPPTYFIVDGLNDAGQFHLARLIAQRYCDLVTHDAGFYENYDAQSGAGLRCPGVCWTAAVFLRLAAFLGTTQSPVIP
jgi:putative isomerase